MGGRPGGIFEIFQNGHIFLKFLFLKNIKKKKARARPRARSPSSARKASWARDQGANSSEPC